MLHDIPWLISMRCMKAANAHCQEFHAAQGPDLTRTVDTDEVDLQVLKKRGHSHMQEDQVQ